MSITNEDLTILKDFLFNDKNKISQFQYDNFHQFMDVSIPHILRTKNIFYETYTDDKLKIIKYGLEFTNIEYMPPTTDNINYVFPEEARTRNLTYSTKLMVNIQQFKETKTISNNEIKKEYIGEKENLDLAKIPIMVGCKYCSTLLKKNIKNNECKYDPGCYFIVNGGEKIIIGLERIIYNQILVFKKKDTTYEDKFTYVATIQSKYIEDNAVQVLNIKIKKDNQIYIQASMFNDIPIFIFIRALGLITDKEISDKIIQNIEDNEMFNILKASINNIKFEPKLPVSETNIEIKTQEDAIIYLVSKLKNVKKFNNSDEEMIYNQKKLLIMGIFKRDLLPHMGSNILKKANFICLMINKLLNILLNRIKPDNRDSLENKRIELAGTLMFILFKAYFKKLMNEITRYFKKKNYPYPGNDNPINIINQIKSNTIEQGIKTSLMTGKWGPSPSKKVGVSQPFQRYNHLQSKSYIKRISCASAGMDAGTSNQTSMRTTKGESYGFICPVASPEGAKVGLIKELALTTEITLDNTKYNSIIKKIISNEIIDILDINYYKINEYIKVFIYGEWIGVTNNPNKIINILDTAKNKHIIDYTITYTLNLNMMSLIINTDEGRMIRPVIKVNNNKLYLTKNIIDYISPSNSNNNKITNWKEFLIKYPYVIDYIDITKSNHSLIAMSLNHLNKENKKSKNIIQKPKPYGNIVNRYNNTVYVKYTHLEIHPSLMLGITASNIPFPEHNQGPRNMFNYSQSRQANGLHVTNTRFRHDNTFDLLNLQKPIVVTQSMSYTDTINMPAGENCIVAICCYSGYNQEDSIILNKSSVNRGFLWSTIYKKYTESITKNPNSSQDDKFEKPDRDRVIGMSDSNYDLLNDKGYVNKETTVNNGDMIIGKITPIKSSESNKIYKDNSIAYKSGDKGVIDGVQYGIIGQDGYESISIKVRSVRIPTIGDKFCSRHGQKGTGGILLSAADMPFSKEGIVPDLIINPNCIPSRMTIGQFKEGYTGKVGAIFGKYIDATAFNELDINEFKEDLKNEGYDEYGLEQLTCGMTGNKMPALIQMFPNFYYVLKHKVQEKIHSRAKGPRTILTRQPPEGRSKDGGLRFGEMERDCMISHGLAQFLKERLVDTSDLFHIYICSECGSIASKVIDKDIYKCKLCNIHNKSYSTHKIEIPYAFKLFIQELQTINIMPKIRINNSSYT
tara:strand:- start:236 stop:3811 length:3576 start_codon:yes stop_codon:yes gene_type:complete